MAHLVLPFKMLKQRSEQHGMMQRGRRGRLIHRHQFFHNVPIGKPI